VICGDDEMRDLDIVIEEVEENEEHNDIEDAYPNNFNEIGSSSHLANSISDE